MPEDGFLKTVFESLSIGFDILLSAVGSRST
jgi:hypothetical protein